MQKHQYILSDSVKIVQQCSNLTLFPQIARTVNVFSFFTCLLCKNIYFVTVNITTQLICSKFARQRYLQTNNILSKTLYTHDIFWNSIRQHIFKLIVVVVQYFALPRPNAFHVQCPCFLLYLSHIHTICSYSSAFWRPGRVWLLR